MSTAPNVTTSRPPWEKKLRTIMDMMRELSAHEDPQEMVAAYAKRMQRILPSERQISISRRGLEAPQFRVTRFSGWKDRINPWKENERLPLLEGGLFSDLIYSDEPRIIDDLQVDEDDPAYPYLEGQRSLMAIPNLDRGVALNMVVITRSEPQAFDKNELPDIVWTSNLFGRATHNLVMADQVREAYNMVDRELKAVADIQRALLPNELPHIPNMQLAAHYQTSQRAGGDYYDFFPLAEGRWGILLADVSGHGTPAAVMMAVTHSIAHMYPGRTQPPSDLLNFVNHHLAMRYTGEVGTFVTAFYGIFDPATRTLTYSSAGHNPPRVKHCGQGRISSLDEARSLPLGVLDDKIYTDYTQRLEPGDQIIFYTDGITEAASPSGELFEIGRLDQVLGHCRDNAKELIDAVLQSVEDFTAAAPASDDRTLVVAKID